MTLPRAVFRLLLNVSRGFPCSDANGVGSVNSWMFLQSANEEDVPRMLGSEDGRSVLPRTGFGADGRPCSTLASAAIGSLPVSARRGLELPTSALSDLGAFDLVITDYQMLLLNGLRLVQRIRQIGFHGRIIVQSGSMTSDAAEGFRTLRVDRIVSRSLRPEAIVELLAGLG